ncbi:Phosphoglucosamine mutase [uncultured Eubacteriales bacterium]|uniref:Phosphoglucosamine mutase n=1 Tax=uncultured Eubacteriales bacterium TaxID=172733 RepID=A0A212JVY0_9FIRM|nr:Phosphoglucosamine mutase [uncultured Eubacteriales bacterium]
MGKLFGTDGIRGVVNVTLDAQLAFKVGQAAAIVLAEESHGRRPLVTIGKDTRISSDLLEGALIAGLCSAGADVLHLGVIPTPAVAYLTAHSGAQAGVVISASHNPFEHNGIKIFNGQGFKLSDALEEEIESIILADTPIPLKTHGDIGKVTYADQKESEAYIDHLVSSVKEDFAGMRVLVDCANGASAATAARLFDRFPKLHTDILNADPDGVNINAGCGSTHMDGLCTMVKAGGYDLGLAFDGDADRCLACDDQGELIDGDQVMALCGRDMKSRGELPGETVVATVMSNLGLHVFCRENGLNLFCTDVGDRNVLEKMEECGYRLGGEQSGHMIFRAFATTGDGQLTALQLLQLLRRSGRKAGDLAGDCKRFPQILVNVSVADRAKKAEIMASQALQDAVAVQEALLGGDGRVLVRPSGTEALVRVMVEAREEKTAKFCAEALVNVIKLL